MSIDGWYEGDQDNVTDNGNVDGWDDQSGRAFGNNIAGGLSYRFGRVIDYYGTWGQLIYENQDDLEVADITNPVGLNQHMPGDPAPGGSYWVQGHLVNGECGGSGLYAAYLTPISHTVNMWHRGYEAVLQRLVNRGTAAGSQIVMFNPNRIDNSRLIYRTQGLPPPAAAGFPTVPGGICVSMGFVINGVMQSSDDVQNEFENPGDDRWFADWYYSNEALAKSDRAKIIEMIGGTEITYPQPLYNVAIHNTLDDTVLIQFDETPVYPDSTIILPSLPINTITYGGRVHKRQGKWIRPDKHPTPLIMTYTGGNNIHLSQPGGEQIVFACIEP